MRHRLIGLCGYKGCGKSTVAQELSRTTPPDPWVSILSFASPMRLMMNQVVSINELFAMGKEAPLKSLNGQSYRHALQTLGTEWGRGFMGKDFWCNQTMSLVAEEIKAGSVVIDDVRFDNEAKAIRATGGIVVQLIRKSVYAGGDSHASEGGILPEYIDAVVDNSGKIEDTVEAILAL